MNKNYEIPNLVKACKILSILSNRPKGIAAVELEDLVQIPRTTAFRILKTLCSEGLAEKRGKLFFSGAGLMQIGLNSIRSLELRPLSVPFLSNLALKTDFTAHLAIPSGWQSLILEVHDSPHPVRVASRSGTTVPLYCSSTGKVFLAYRFEEVLEAYFEQTAFEAFTANTITTLSAMRQEIETIRQNGFAVDNQEFHMDVRCLAAPVRDSHGQVVAAIGVTGPAIHLTTEKQAGVGRIVKEVAAEFSAVLGFTRE